MKLEELLKLKKFEKPSEAQWEEFDKKLKNKMLLCIVNEQQASSSKWFKLSVLSVSACLLFGIGFLVSSISRPPYIREDSVAFVQVEEVPTPTQNYYIEHEVLPQNFDKPAAALSKEESGVLQTNYIANTIGHMEVTGF